MHHALSTISASAVLTDFYGRSHNLQASNLPKTKLADGKMNGPIENVGKQLQEHKFWTETEEWKLPNQK